MWELVEYSIEPMELDDTSSSSVVYIRRNIKLVEAKNERDAHWECEEHRVPKEQWDVYKDVLMHGIEISEVQDALTELAEIIVG